MSWELKGKYPKIFDDSKLGSRAREASGEMNAHAVDTVQGLVEIVAFQQERARGRAFAARFAPTTLVVATVVATAVGLLLLGGGR